MSEQQLHRLTGHDPVDHSEPVEAATARAVQIAGRSIQKLAGGLAALAIAAVVYSQFNLYRPLMRDDAIYLYGGQRVTHGVPPYASIMDPKGPMSGILDGFGVAVARLFGHSDLLAARVEYCALAVLSVLGIYLLVLELWHSVVAGVIAAAVFTSFKWYAGYALTGPQGHMPGIVFLIFAMWLTVRRQWYWAGFAAALAFFSWQPLFAYPFVVLLCAAVWSPGRRSRAVCWNLAGAATPFVALVVYYAGEGYLGKFFEGTFLFPLTGVRRTPMPFGYRVHFIFHDIWATYGSSAILLWIGLVLLVIEVIWTFASSRSEWPTAVTHPIVLLIFLSLIAQVAYVLYDYIGGAHAFPLLPYGAVGFGAGAARLLRHLSRQRVRRMASATLLAAVVAMTVFYAVDYYQPSDNTALLGQKASSCALQQSLAPRTTLWVLGNPIPLVLLHRVNPDNYPYIGSGLAKWRVEHTPGGFAGWMGQIKAVASIVVLQDWEKHTAIGVRIYDWLRTHGYRRGFIGQWHVYVTSAARARMATRSIALTPKSHPWPLTITGTELHSTGCIKIAAG